MRYGLYRLKRLGSYLTIIILLPYVITVLMNGKTVETASGVSTYLVNVGEQKVPLEEYCIGRLASEIPISYEKEALKTQAVIVRTCVYGEILKNGSKADFSDSYWDEAKMKENWGETEYGKNYRRLKEVWSETEGQVLMYGDAPANVPFFRLSNGCTRDGKEVLGSDEFPYLMIRECPLDVEAKEQVQTVVLDELDAEVVAQDGAGYVTKVREGDQELSGEEFREKYKLASGSFVIQQYNGKTRITTRGVGHGLGLSQYTANQMAKSGKKYKDILNYFFEGTEIKEVADIVNKG